MISTIKVNDFNREVTDRILITYLYKWITHKY